ncbi:MAG: rpfC 1, partial [Hyphomicrobiales bacterium]|nr:rpfC 1 [Hyphomicrobiales bacterium]
EANALLAVVARYSTPAEPREQEAPPTAPLALAPIPSATLIPFPAAKPSAAPVDDPVESGAIDPRALRDLAALGGDEFVSEIITQFVADAAGVLKSLADSVAQQDVDGFRDHAHALRSCAANVGAQAVYKMCLDLRAIEPQELAANGVRHVRELEAHFERARAELSSHVG